MNGNTPGDFMAESTQRNMKTMAMFIGVSVYLGAIVFAASHNFNLLTSGVSPNLVFWAYIGVVMVSLSAVGMPVAYHYWTAPGLHRIACGVFYFIDLAMLAFNTILDNALVSNLGVPPWLSMYLGIAPATPLVVGVMWSVLWILDPSNRRRDTLMSLRSATEESLARQIAEAARGGAASRQVISAAQGIASDFIGNTVRFSPSASRNGGPPHRASIPSPVAFGPSLPDTGWDEDSEDPNPFTPAGISSTPDGE